MKSGLIGLLGVLSACSIVPVPSDPTPTILNRKDSEAAAGEVFDLLTQNGKTEMHDGSSEDYVTCNVENIRLSKEKAKLEVRACKYHLMGPQEDIKYLRLTLIQGGMRFVNLDRGLIGVSYLCGLEDGSEIVIHPVRGCNLIYNRYLQQARDELRRKHSLAKNHE